MKKLNILILGIMLMIPILVQGQNDRLMNSTPEERAEVHTQWMQKNLSLSKNQLDKIEPLNLKYAKEIEKLKSTDISNLEKINQIKEIDKRRLNDFKTILNQEQFKTYSDKRKELLELIKKLVS